MKNAEKISSGKRGDLSNAWLVLQCYWQATAGAVLVDIKAVSVFLYLTCL